MTETDAPLLYDSEPRALQLANTVWASKGGVRDSLESTASLRRWAAAAGIPGHASLTNTDLHEARRLRDAIRRLAAEVTDDDRPPAVQGAVSTEESLAALNDLLESRSATLVRAADGRLTVGWAATGSAFRGALAEIAAEAADLLSGDSGEIRACRGPGCVLYFARDSGRREWCSPGCGNRARVARHYRRHRTQG